MLRRSHPPEPDSGERAAADGNGPRNTIADRCVPDRQPSTTPATRYTGAAWRRPSDSRTGREAP